MVKSQHTQSDILEILQRDHEQFTALSKQLSKEEQLKPITPEGWSVKDFLGHMTHWKKETHALLVAYIHDQPLPPAIPAGDAANEAQQQQDVARSLEDTLADWEETHTHLQHIVIDELDTQRLTEEVRVPWDQTDTEPIGVLIADMCGHDAEHFAFIEQHFMTSQQ